MPGSVPIQKYYPNKEKVRTRRLLLVVLGFFLFLSLFGLWEEEFIPRVLFVLLLGCAAGVWHASYRLKKLVGPIFTLNQTGLYYDYKDGETGLIRWQGIQRVETGPSLKEAYFDSVVHLIVPGPDLLVANQPLKRFHVDYWELLGQNVIEVSVGPVELDRDYFMSQLRVFVSTYGRSTP